ncbi:cleavage and polyadenylation specificity factor subunit 3-like isoform X3 [Apostichopus japonicus]
MAEKRKTDAQIPEEETDRLIIRPLGAGQEVGRSCIMLEFKGKKIMLDCGIHPGREGLDSLPFFDMIDPEEIDLLLISHFHLDHCGALPYFLKTSNYRGQVYMTHATKAIYRWLLNDYVRVSNLTSEKMLYSEADLITSMDRIETVNFHQEVEVNGIKFWCYNAGHVLGAAMIMLEIAGVKILYTGDFSRQEDRHLMSAEIPNIKADVLITESTYGTHIHEKRDERETRFTSTVHDIVNRGGRCLIPVFALGRAQELLLILDEYWANHPELHDIPVYYASALAKKCMSVYQTYINAMNDKIKRQINISNPFVFKHISNLKDIDHFDDVGPSVIMASPGMLQSGLSRELMENWCTDRRNGVIISGYSVEGTLAKHIMSSPEEIVTMTGQKLPLKMSVDYISFSAHSDYEQTSEFIRTLKPPHVVLVHGEANEMSRLKAAILREYEDDPEYHIQVHNPRITQAVELYFRGEKMAKVMGSLAVTAPSHNHKISGILVKRNFNYHIMSPKDLADYTDLKVSTITQRMSVSYSAPLSLLTHYLIQLCGQVEYITVNEKSALKVFENITVIHEPQQNIVILEWTANAVNDMYADAIIAVLMKVSSDPKYQKVKRLPEKNDPVVFAERVSKLLGDVFGPENVTCIGPHMNNFRVGLESGKTAILELETMEVQSDDESMKKLIETCCARLQEAIEPSTLK